MVAHIPAFSAAAVEAICRELAETMTGSQIPGLLAPLKLSTATDTDGLTKWKRLYNAVAEAQNRQQDGRPLIRLVTEAMQPVRFHSDLEFAASRRSLNAKLLLYGFEVREDGKVARSARAATLTEAQERANALERALRERNIHRSVLAFCKPELLRENYFHAVLEATKSLADRIREMTGLEKDGAELVDLATGVKQGPPLLAFNALSTEWERSEHTGLAMLAKGLFASVRNPTAHAPKVKWAVELQEALDVLTLVSMLHRRLDTASSR